jgi:serine/threonine protein kinase
MRVTVTITAGPAEGLVFTFDKPDVFLFGRAADASVSLSLDKYLSRHHFLLEVAPPTCKVTDLDSSNGLYVNDIRYGGKAAPPERVQCAPGGVKERYLRDGDEIAVGQTRMKVAIEQDTSETEEATVMLGNVLAGAESTLMLRHESAPSGLPTVSGYRIESELGRGAVGVVYKAVQIASGRTVAIKTLLPQVATDLDHARAFEREIEITRQLKHPNIVELLAHGTSRDEAGVLFYLVLEYVDGMDLDRYVEENCRPLALPLAAPILLGALDGLAYAHAAVVNTTFPDGAPRVLKGVVHRDLTPRNVLLARAPDGKNWIPKLADFGLAKSFESAGMTNMTRPGQLAGTPSYWPREQITHYTHACPATDVFSMAAVIYKALTGAYVRDGINELLAECQQRGRPAGIPDFMRVISANPVRPIRDRDADLPAPVAEVLDRALREAEVAGDEEATRIQLGELRYADAGAFRDALVTALQQSGINV